MIVTAIGLSIIRRGDRAIIAKKHVIYILLKPYALVQNLKITLLLF